MQRLLCMFCQIEDLLFLLFLLFLNHCIMKRPSYSSMRWKQYEFLQYLFSKDYIFCVQSLYIWLLHDDDFSQKHLDFHIFLTLIFFLYVFFMVLVIQCLLKYDFLTFSHYFSYFIACVCLSDCSGNRTHNHLVCKRTLNHLCKQAKWMSYVVSIYLYGAFNCILLSCHARISKWIYTL